MKAKIQLYPINTMTESKSGVYMVYKDYYWIVDENQNLLKYNGMSWQCNINKHIVENLRNKCYPECSVVQIPLVFTEWNG